MIRFKNKARLNHWFNWASSISACNYFTVMAIFYLQNYESSYPFTISYVKFLHLTGKLLTSPYGIPYDPSLKTPIETTLSVPWYQSLKWSTTALAAEKTELPPLTSKISPPLFWTLEMYVFSSHYWSTNSEIGCPFTLICLMHGYWVVEWFPNIMTPSISLYLAWVFSAIWLILLLWSSLDKQVMFYFFILSAKWPKI